MKEISFRVALQEALKEEMIRDDRVFLIGEDIGRFGGSYKVTEKFLDTFGEKRVIDTPISEAGIIATSLGAALTGLRPVSEIMYMDFITAAMDPVVNQVAKVKYMYGGNAVVPLVIRTQCGAGRGTAAQHSQSLESWFMHVPGLKVVIPSTPYDAKGLLKTAIRDDNPVVFIEHKMLYNSIGLVPKKEYTIPFGKAIIRKKGNDVTVIANSYMLPRALDASAEVEKEGISVELIDPLTLVPLDEETILESVRKTGRLVIVHEANKRVGFGAEIAAIVAENEIFHYLKAPIKRVTSLDVPVPYSRKLEEYWMPDVDKIMNAIKNVCRKNKKE